MLLWCQKKESSCCMHTPFSDVQLSLEQDPRMAHKGHQLSWQGGGRRQGRAGRCRRMDGTAAPHRSAGTDGPGPGGGGGGDEWVGGWVVGARGDMRGGLLPAVMFCTLKPSVVFPSPWARFHQVHIFLAYLCQVCCQSMIGVLFGFTM